MRLRQPILSHFFFYRIANILGAISAIDCTHIRIVSPDGQNAARFFNRKGCYSLNTPVVCDANMKVTNIVARWPGATHDRRIFLNSRLCILLENNPNLQGDWLRDNGYHGRIQRGGDRGVRTPPWNFGKNVLIGFVKWYWFDIAQHLCKIQS